MIINEPGWYLKHKSASGASLEEIEKMVEEIFQEGKLIKLDAIIDLGILVDICYHRRTETGMIMGIKEVVFDDTYKYTQTYKDWRKKSPK